MTGTQDRQTTRAFTLVLVHTHLAAHKLWDLTPYGDFAGASNAVGFGTRGQGRCDRWAQLFVLRTQKQRNMSGEGWSPQCFKTKNLITGTNPTAHPNTRTHGYCRASINPQNSMLLLCKIRGQFLSSRLAFLGENESLRVTVNLKSVHKYNLCIKYV